MQRAGAANRVLVVIECADLPGGEMARVPIDILAQLESHRAHVLRSAERMARSAELKAEITARIESSVALLERARTLKWPVNVPTLPRWILPRRKNTSESKSD